jgi:hypothetical protein
MTRNLSALSAVSYSMMLVFATPMLYNPAPNGLSPPTMAAPFSALAIQLTRGPNTMTGPMPGIGKKADPSSKPHKPRQKFPSLPQIFIRSPAM